MIVMCSKIVLKLKMLSAASKNEIFGIYLLDIYLN